jgi:hypothetical protein
MKPKKIVIWADVEWSDGTCSIMDMSTVAVGQVWHDGSGKNGITVVSVSKR